ncbi:hypothetical protein [Bdellovibrio bacteriovorus]|uniref:hypothetical protein n=1 Tax=Bdellovibrio bacteriovorus TaxID=959 RepID=UPI003AA986B1
MAKAIVKQKEGKPEVTVEVLAQSIAEISKGMKALRKGRLKEKTLILLISTAAGVNKGDVQAVLTALESLESIYLKPEEKA